MNLREHIVAWIWDRRWLCAIACVLVTLVAGWHAARIGVDNSLEIWFLDDDPQLVSYRAFQRTFGNDEVVVIAFHDQGGLADEKGLALLRRAASAIERVDGVAGVVSLASIVDANALGPAPPQAPHGESANDALRERIHSDPQLIGRFVSRDGTLAALVARMAALENMDARRDAIISDIDAALAELRTPYRKAGIGVLYAALNRLSVADTLALFGACVVVMFGVLWVLFRRLAAVLSTMGIATVATIWTMGLYGAAGRELNMVTTVMPAVILVVGIAEAVHVLLHAATVPLIAGRREKVIAAVGLMLQPCLLNIVTSAAGFAALAVSPLPAVRDLGIFTAAGLIGCLGLTIVGCTFALAWTASEPRPRRNGLLAAAAERLCDVGIRCPLVTLAFAAMIAVAAVAASTRLVVDTFTLDFLLADHPVRRDSEFIETRLGPYVPLDFVVRSPGGPVRPDLLEAIGRWQSAAERLDGVGWSRSLVDALRRDPRSMPDSVPALASRIAEYRIAPGAQLDPLVDNGGALRVTFSVRMQSANNVARTMRAIRDEARLPPDTTVSAAGYLPLYVRMVDHVVASQLNGFALAFAAVFAVIALAFRSLRLAALSIPSNVLPLLLILAAMGAAGIRLDGATVTIASIVLGLVVDDTVHFLHRLREELGRNPDREAALRETARSCGHAILITCLVMTLGFSLFALAEIKSVISFGLLIALAMGTSVVTDLLVLPALVMFRFPRVARRRHAHRSV